MRAGRQAVVLDRILDATTLEGVFCGPQKDRDAAHYVLAAVAAGRSRAARLAVAKVACVRDVTPQYVVDRVMVFVARIMELRRQETCTRCSV